MCILIGTAVTWLVNGVGIDLDTFMVERTELAVPQGSGCFYEVFAISILTLMELSKDGVASSSRFFGVSLEYDGNNLAPANWVASPKYFLAMSHALPGKMANEVHGCSSPTSKSQKHTIGPN